MKRASERPIRATHEKANLLQREYAMFEVRNNSDGSELVH